MKTKFKYLIIIFLAIFVEISITNAQKNISSEDAENLSYKYYLSGKWDSLIHIANIAINNNIDYFYLRVRLGIAYYEKEMYENAYYNLEKALQFYPNDEFTTNLLKKAAILCGKEKNSEIEKIVYDEITYKYFILSEWDKVIKYGKEAIEKNIEFQYLHARIGIAYFYKEKYVNALKHFDKELSKYPDNDVILSYAVYSNKYLSRDIISYYYLKQMSDSSFKKTKLSKTFNNATFYADFNLLTNNLPQKPNYIINPSQDIFVKNDRNHNALQLNFLLKTRLLKNFEIYIAENYLNLQKENIFTYKQPYIKDSIKTNQMYQGNNVWNYIYDFKIETTKNKYELKQHFIYGGLSCRLTKNLTINSAISVISDNYKKYILLFPELRINSIQNIPKSKSKFRIEETDTTALFYLYNFSLTKYLPFIIISISQSFSNINFAKQTNTGLSAFYNFTNNLNLYGKSEISFFKEKNETFNTTEQRIIFSQMLGSKLTKFLWCELFGQFGGLSNYSGIFGNTPYNSTDKTNWLAGIKFITPINNNLTFELSYSTMNMENIYEIHKEIQNPSQINKPKIEFVYYKYNYNLIKGGIIWKL